MTVVMDPAQSKDFNARAEQPAQDRSDHQSGEKPENLTHLECKISSDHVNARMSEVEDAHHAEDQRQPTCEHEQQHAVYKTVHQRDDDGLHQLEPCRDARMKAVSFCMLSVMS